MAATGEERQNLDRASENCWRASGPGSDLFQQQALIELLKGGARLNSQLLLQCLLTGVILAKRRAAFSLAHIALHHSKMGLLHTVIYLKYRAPVLDTLIESGPTPGDLSQ